VARAIDRWAISGRGRRRARTACGFSSSLPTRVRGASTSPRPGLAATRASRVSLPPAGAIFNPPRCRDVCSHERRPRIRRPCPPPAVPDAAAGRRVRHGLPGRGRRALARRGRQRAGPGGSGPRRARVLRPGSLRARGPRHRDARRGAARGARAPLGRLLRRPGHNDLRDHRDRAAALRSARPAVPAAQPATT